MDNNQYPNNNQQQAPQYQQPQYQQAPQYQQPQYQQPMYQAPMYPQAPQNHPAKGLAIGSMICGIVGLVFVWFGVSSFITLIAGIVGLILAINAKKKGFVGGMLTAGMVMSIISLVLGAIVFVACIGLVGCSACMAADLGYYY